MGSGAGLPGIPIAIMLPDSHITLLEHSSRHVDFLRSAAEKLNLNNVSVIHMNAEDAAQCAEFRERFDVPTARRVAPMIPLCEIMLPFVKIGGYMIALKGPDAEDAITDAVNAVKILGGEVACVKKISVTGKYAVFIRKTSSTPQEYPRKYNIPRKNILR